MSKTILTMNDTVIHSLHELREHFNLKEALIYLQNGSLVSWLNEHYYEFEADMLSHLKPEDIDAKHRLCNALRVDYDNTLPLSDEDMQNTKQRIQLLREHISDEEILSKYYQIALNQEDLATLLNSNTQEIYLCHDTFSIPISKAGIHYIGLDNATIENPYTMSQYMRAGITIDNIKTAEFENPLTKAYAEKAAFANGYDAFGETHAALTTKIHKAFKRQCSPELYSLSHTIIDDHICYHSRSECAHAIKVALLNAYDEASTYFCINSSKSLAQTFANRYSPKIIHFFSDIMDNLAPLFYVTQQQQNLNHIQHLISKSKLNLKEIFEHELSRNFEFYQMNDFEHYLNLTAIESVQTSPEINRIFKPLECLVPDKITYTHTGIATAISQMQRDLANHAFAFHVAVLREYNKYIAQIEDIIEQLCKEFDDFKPNESINDYLTRQYTRLAE